MELEIDQQKTRTSHAVLLVLCMCGPQRCSYDVSVELEIDQSEPATQLTSPVYMYCAEVQLAPGYIGYLRPGRLVYYIYCVLGRCLAYLCKPVSVYCVLLVLNGHPTMGYSI